MAQLEKKEQIAVKRRYPVGAQIAAEVALPVDTKESRVFVSRDNWPDLGPSVDVVEIRQWFSYDNGVTWEFGGSSTHTGGEAIHRKGHVMPDCILGRSWIPQEKNPNRKIRVEIIPLVPLDAAVSLMPTEFPSMAKIN